MPLLKRAILAALLLCLPRAAGAASDDVSHWANDPDSGCALFDASLRPGDSIAWSGACKDGRADGQGTVRFSNNGTEFESFTGNFAGGVAADGPVTVTWGDGWSYDGQMQAGHFEGQGVLVNDKKDRFEGQWKDGKLNGKGSVVHQDGSRYDGEWKNDKPNGQGVLTRADGSKLDGEFVDGKFTESAPAPAAPTLAAAAQPQPAALDEKAASEPVKGASALAGLSGKKLIAVDGAALNLIAIEGGIERDITAANGALEKTTFIFINDKLGTVAADGGHDASNGSDVTGFFRLTDNGVEVRYADGHGEMLSALDDGVLLRLQAQGSADVCRSFFPEGHAFSDAEKKAAVAEYASRLGLAAPDSKSGCPSDVAASATPPVTPVPDSGGAKPTKPEHHAEIMRPAKIAPAKFEKPSLKDKVGSLEAVSVKDSVVHAIDALPGPDSAPQSMLALAVPAGAQDAIAAPAAGSAAPGQHDASTCLKVESDGSHWGFRNSCHYDVQFSYCLAAGGDSLTQCSAGGVAGSVAAGSFGALVADKSFSEADAEHDFRWLGCDGGAGEVVAHLDHPDPPSGRCVRAGDLAMGGATDGAINQKDGK
jgi:hypothetical protein